MMNFIRQLMQPVRLPDQFENRKLIKNIQIGESAYTVPWAMYVNTKMECYLNGNYHVLDGPSGTANMLISHTSNGFYVNIPPGETFDIDKDIPWYGASEDCLIPVAGFTNAYTGKTQKL